MIMPVSDREFEAHTKGRIPEPEQVTDGIWTLPLANKPGHMPFTFSYIIMDEAGQAHLIDTGWGLEPNMRALEHGLRMVGVTRGPASITATHLHTDHLSLARDVRERYGTKVAMHRLEDQAQRAYGRRNADVNLVLPDLEAWGVPAERFEQVLHYAVGSPRIQVPADELLDDGQHLSIPGRKLRVIHTPGHTPGHICLYEENENLLFSGDQLLPKMNPGIGMSVEPHINPLEKYLQSLDLLSQLFVTQCLPGHEYRFREVSKRAQRLAARHLQRTTQVAEVLESNPQASPWQVASQLSWSRGWQGLDRHYLVSALRQTAMHMQLVERGAHRKALTDWNRA